MSSIKTTQIDGDVSVGRNVAMGGKAKIAGSVNIGHNLRVEGWLEAVNIKGVNKGIFLTVEALREAYPNPHDGWFAGVGDSTPFAAYIGHGGEWVATGGTIEVTVDMTQYTEDVETLQEEVTQINEALEDKADLDDWGGTKKLTLSQLPLFELFNIEAINTTSPSSSVVSNNKMWYYHNSGNDHMLYYRDSNGQDHELGRPPYILYYYGNGVYKWTGSSFSKVVSADIDLSNYFTKSEVNELLGGYATLNTLGGYFTKSEVNTLLAGYVTLTAWDEMSANISHKADIQANVGGTGGMLKAEQWPDVMLYNVVPISPLEPESYNWDSIPVGSIYLEDGLNSNVPYRKLFWKTHVEQQGIVDLGKPQSGTIYCHKETGNTYRWEQSADQGLGEFVQIGSLGADAVREFAAVIGSATVTSGKSTAKSTDDNAQVFYVTALNQFVLGVRNDAVPQNWPHAANTPRQSHLMALNLVPHTVTVVSYTRFEDEVLRELVQQFAVQEYYDFYLDWADRDLFSDADYKPVKNKLFICTSSDVSYYFNTDAGSLTAISDPGLEARLFFNGNVLTGSEGDNITLSQFVALTTGDSYAYIRKKGVVITLSTPDGLKSYQWRGGTESTSWTTTANWRDFGGSATVGNCYNVTNEASDQLPAGTGYFTLATAIAATQYKGVEAVGMQITFAVGANTWKTYQYVGCDTTSTNFTDQTNWVDMAGMTAGDEAIINVLGLCGPCAQGDYTLEYAIAAIVAKETATGITYRKPGLVISYPKGDNVWETKQYNGSDPDDFGQVGLWTDFGGGGSTEHVETSDEPADGGEDAFSTGGAYQHLAKGAEILEPSEAEELVDNADTENNNYFMLVNADGNRIGNPFAVPKGGGGGSTSNKFFTIRFEHSPFYAAAGGSFVLNVAIRSVTVDGVSEDTETIERVDIIDFDTSQVLYSNRNINRASSASSTTYDFSFDLSSYFTAATTRRLQLIAYDSAGDVRSQRVNVTAVDVTVESTQVLNYTDDRSSVVMRTDTAKSLRMYRFPNNQGNQGILAVVEMYYDGAWRTLGSAVITDTYGHNISVSPHNAFGNGEQLHHGSHPIRIYGTDIASGVQGNVIYSSIMVIEADNNTPIVALRYNSTDGGYVRMYDSVMLDVAVYDPQNYNATVSVKENAVTIANVTIARNTYQTITRQITTGHDGDTLAYVGTCGVGGGSNAISLIIRGSAIDAALTDGADYNFDFSGRTNSETDHSIVSGNKEITLNGANYSSNGFNNYLGANALAIKENVTAELNDAPFSTSSVSSTGFSLLFAFAANNIADNETNLMECRVPETGAGFYINGQSIGIYCGNKKEERTYPLGEKITVGFVVEPTSVYEEFQGTRYSLIKLFLNGEECACLEYTNAGSLLQSSNIRFNGVDGDFYLYYLIGWRNYIVWHQQFYNYLVKLSNTDAMIAEYDFEDVWGGNTSNGPTLSKLDERGMPYLIEAPFQGSNVEALDNTTSTSDQIFINLTYRDPHRPWRDFIAYNVRRRNQGTTSAKRPVKNARYNLARKSKNNATYEVDGVVYSKVCIIKPLHTREEIVEMGYDGALWDEAAALMEKNKIRVGEDTIPVDVITVKVDYSDSTNANDCGVCNLMNATYRALGEQFMTPAQRYYDGTYDIGSGESAVHLSGLQLNHSTANHPIAMYRDLDGSGTTIKFYAKGNWKEDKGEQVALGFMETPGYNKGCLNYQDESFTEYFGLPEDDTIAKVVARFEAEVTADPNAYDQNHPVLLSMYCGSSYKFYRYQNGAWTDTTGTMLQVNGEWVITGDVLNPVDGFELLAYQGMCWWQGVSSVADMMAPTTSHSSWVKKLGYGEGQEVPAWTQFFECMIENDQLQADLAAGKKVPYWLYRLLKFCNDCDFNNPNVDLSGYWHDNLYKFANVHALYAYNAFTDYLAAVDQQAKNMQPMFFLDDGGEVLNGVYNDEQYVRMYPNKVYDCDTCNGKDNAGGATVDPEVDPNKPDDVATGYSNPYAGWGSVLWNNIYRQPTVKFNASEEISMKSVVSSMRTRQATIDGITLVPFSPEGCKHFFMDNICKRWQKTVSSFDGENKYIKSTSRIDTSVEDNSLYFYALHGLRLTALPSFIDRRFRIRDGFYGTGLFFSSVFSSRINAASGTGITIKAAKTGYFGVGSDNSGNLRESVYLEAGQSHRFTMFDHTSGSLLYIYQSNRMSEIDLSEISLSQTDTTPFNMFSLAEKICIGGENHTNLAIGSYAPMTIPTLGELPFLKHLDVSNTLITDIDASRCPRLETLVADGSRLTSVTLAETSPVATLSLPSTITELKAVNLPKLSYPGGLTFDSMVNITKLMISGCPLIDGGLLLSDIVDSGAYLDKLRLAGLNASGSSSTLETLMEMGVTGIAADGTPYTESNQCSGMTGSWSMTDMVSDADLLRYQHYFPELAVYNLQYTMIEFDETTTYDGNITNLENGTKDGVLNGYEPSGHITKLKSQIHVYAGNYDDNAEKLLVQQVSDLDINSLVDGTSIDITDLSGSGMDLFVGLPHYWYKGINDHRNQKKYIAFSTEVGEPHSTASKTNRGRIGDIQLRASYALYTANFGIGDVFSDSNLTSNSNYNVYRRDVDGMKQVRWPGVSSLSIGAIFLDKDDKVISVVTTNITHANNDFVAGEDYLFIAVPANAVSFVFTSPKGCDDLECIAVDSTAIEAIEPDWVEHGMEFIGVYKASIDSQMRLRSISHANIVYGKGSGDSVSSSHWRYDANGDLTVGLPTDATVINNMKYTCTDFQNLGKARGKGYQIVDYEMHKNVANLWMAIKGRRNAQAVNGYGVSNNNANNSTSKVTGGTDSTSNKSPFRETVANGTNQVRVRTLGFEDWWANYSEWMDNVVVNAASYDGYYKTHGSGVTDRVAPSGSVADGIWHIRMPDGSERAVRGVTTGGDAIEICRVRNGRFADVVPSRVVTIANLNSYNTYYCDGNYYQPELGRCVNRSSFYAGSGSPGIVYVNAGYDAARSYGFNGSRLAFRGEFEIV